MIRTQIQLQEGLYDRLRLIAVRRHCSMASCVREAIAAYVVKQQSPTDDLSDIAGKFRPVPADGLKPHDRAWARSVLPEPAVESEDGQQ